MSYREARKCAVAFVTAGVNVDLVADVIDAMDWAFQHPQFKWRWVSFLRPLRLAVAVR